MIKIKTNFLNNRNEFGIYGTNINNHQDVFVMAEYDNSKEQCTEKGTLIYIDGRKLFKFLCSSNINILNIYKINVNVYIQGIFTF